MSKLTPTSIALAMAACISPINLHAADIEVESAQVRLIDDVEVPAQVKGVLKTIAVKEGQHVGEGDPIAQLDDSEAILERDRAQIDLDKALKLEKDDVKLRVAQKTLLDARLAVERAKLDLLIASKQADSDIKVRLTRKTSAVAVAELDRALKSRAAVEDAVSQSEVDMLQLSVARSGLEIEQAELELEIARLTLRVQQAEVDRLKLGIDSAELDVEQAEHDVQIAVDDRRGKTNELKTAQLMLDRRSIVSPVSGVVAKIFHRRGEWVEPGEAVMRIVRMDRLRIEGFVNADQLSGQMIGAPATVHARVAGNPKAEFKGDVVFVSPEIDAVNNQVRVWVEVDNPQTQLRPGMRVTMTIQIKDSKTTESPE